MGSQEPEDFSVVPELAADCDVATLPLSPAEGFLLSRIDGHTPWSVLRECGVLPAEDVDRALRAWGEQGIVSLGGKPEPPPAVGASVATESGSASVSANGELSVSGEALIDPGLDLDVEQQRAILAFEERLGGSYEEILGVKKDADAKTLKRAYFKLSKDFHPDRYFRKNLGAFADRLDRVFCKISEAYELLSDPSARKEMEKTLSQGSGPAASAGPRLKGKTTPHAFSLVARIQRERRKKAQQYFQAGTAAMEAEDWSDAAHQLRLAIACDPKNEDYKAPFGEANRRANDERAERYLKEANSRYDLGEYEAAYKRYVDALHCRPFDAEANARAAVLAWRIAKDLKAAKEYAQRACEVEEDNASHRKVLGQIYAAAELYLNAQSAYEQAVRLNPGDEESRLELKRMKKLARQGPRGGA